MPAGPCQTAGWPRGKTGWFNERYYQLLAPKCCLHLLTSCVIREETIIVNRVIREDPSKSDMHNREPVTPRLLWKSLKDFDLWPLYILGLMFQIPTTPQSSYLTLTLKSLGWDTFEVNLVNMPYYALHSEFVPRVEAKRPVEIVLND